LRYCKLNFVGLDSGVCLFDTFLLKTQARKIYQKKLGVTRNTKNNFYLFFLALCRMSLKAGIEIVTKATEHDTNKRYNEAIHLYTIALDHLQKALSGI
jgi:hypothetical protein